MTSPAPAAAPSTATSTNATSTSHEPSRVSVLMVNFNGGEVLEDCVQKLMARRADWHELIIADNGSSDGSVARLEKSYPEIKTLRLGANLGFGTANNRAAAMAEGEYLLLLNSDAWPEEGCLPALRRALDQDPGLAWVSPRLIYPDGRPQFHWGPTTSIIGEAQQKLRNLFESRAWVHRLKPKNAGWFTAACGMVRRRAFEAVGGFDEGFFLYFEDVDLCLRLRRAGWRLDDRLEATAAHVKGGSQDGAGDPSAGLHYRLAQARYYRKHRPRWEQRVIRWKILKRLSDAESRVLVNRVFNTPLES